MKFRNETDNDNLNLNITPLIDVVFLLLIFFMVSTTFIYTDSIKVNLPEAKGEGIQVKDNIVITVTEDEHIFINSKNIAKPLIFENLRNLKKKNSKSTVIIQADKKATHGIVVYIMDQSKKAGFDHFAISIENE